LKESGIRDVLERLNAPARKPKAAEASLKELEEAEQDATDPTHGREISLK
jgi:hypothetical protein